jgi:hypothetical protein
MTRDDVIRMAREAGLLNCECCLPFFDEDDHKNWERFFVNFANLVAAAEREACRRAFDAYLLTSDPGPLRARIPKSPEDLNPGDDYA